MPPSTTVLVTATDTYGNAGSDGSTDELVVDTNGPPIANADNYNIQENSSLSTILGVDDILQNDTDPDGDTLTVNTTPIVGPTNGSLILNADGTFTYTPDPDFNGVDTFTYEITDGNGEFSQAVVTITITSVNSAPVANADNYTIAEDGSLIPGSGVPDLLANDTDPDGDSLTVNVTPVTGPANGLLALNPDGTFTYSPDENFNGSDGFTYEVSDGNGGIAQGSVTITVTPVNDAPITAGDNFNINNGEALTLLTSGLISNDMDIEGEALTIISFTQPVNGTVFGNGDGTFVYTPPPGFEGVDSFTYTVADESGAESIAAVVVDVIPFQEAEPITAEPDEGTPEPENPVTPPEPEDEVTEREFVAGPDNSEPASFGEYVALEDGSITAYAPAELDGGIVARLLADQKAGDDVRGGPTSVDKTKYTVESIGTFDFDGFTFRNVNLDHNALWQALDTMKREMAQIGSDSSATAVIQIASGSSIALTAGFISWVLRGGALSAALLSTLPMWKGFDPLPLLAANRSKDDKRRKNEDTESMEKTYEESSPDVERIFSPETLVTDRKGLKK